MSVSLKAAQLANHNFIKTSASVAKSSKVKHEDFMEIEHWALAQGISSASLLMAKLGKQLAECDSRISEIQKELKELKRAIK